MADDKRLIAPTDLYHLAAVEDPRISPDGAWIAFVRRTRREHDNATVRAIWLVRPDGSGLRQFTSGVKPDTSPRWSPDGRWLAFVSTRRDDKPQIYLIPADGGEAQPLTWMPNGATDPAWSLDGRQIAFLSRLRPDEMQAEDGSESLPPARPEDLPKPDEEADKARIDPRVITRLPYRVGTSYWDGRFSQVYVVAVEPDEAGLRRPRRLTRDQRDYEAPRWSADGLALFSAASRRPDHDMPSMFYAVVRIALEDGALAELTGAGLTCHAVDPSPDGRWLAFLAQPDELPMNRDGTLAVLPVEGGDVRHLTDALDRGPEEFRWLRDSSGLVFSVPDRGAVPICRVLLDRKGVEFAGHSRACVTGLDAGPDGLLAAAVFTEDGQFDLYAGGKQLTTFNRAFLETVRVAPFEALHYTAPDGTPIDGWLLYPADYEPGRRYPLAVNIHGGPQGMWGATEPTMWLEWQHHAASGYAVFFCNPRGSDGYGEAFIRANHPDWGDGPQSDVLAGVDLLVARGIADPDRLVLTGGSYGGYLTAWIVGHDHRFKAAVAQRGVYHLQAFHGTTDIPWFMTSNLGAEPWDDPDLFWLYSPLAYAQDITTPLLILHSEQDYRVPISEGEQLFAVMKRVGKAPVELVRYPREGHELSRAGEPKHIIDRLERIVAWWDTYCPKD